MQDLVKFSRILGIYDWRMLARRKETQRQAVEPCSTKTSKIWEPVSYTHLDVYKRQMHLNYYAFFIIVLLCILIILLCIIEFLGSLFYYYVMSIIMHCQLLCLSYSHIIMYYYVLTFVMHYSHNNLNCKIARFCAGSMLNFVLLIFAM